MTGQCWRVMIKFESSSHLFVPICCCDMQWGRLLEINNWEYVKLLGRRPPACLDNWGQCPAALPGTQPPLQAQGKSTSVMTTNKIETNWRSPSSGLALQRDEEAAVNSCPPGLTLASTLIFTFSLTFSTTHLGNGCFFLLHEHPNGVQAYKIWWKMYDKIWYDGNNNQIFMPGSSNFAS